jgi:hypothetical protein
LVSSIFLVRRWKLLDAVQMNILAVRWSLVFHPLKVIISASASGIGSMITKLRKPWRKQLDISV